uniref:Uncharacterized protein n=1 Tax=viral metagenome TaxID=1070528 RepID=A0A6C0IFL7_9ZZZZ
MYSIYSTIYHDQALSSYNCYLDEKEWLRVTNDFESSRVFARIINGEKSWICALGNPISIDSNEDIKPLFVPQWMLDNIEEDGSGSLLEVQWMPADVFDNSNHIVLEPFDDISGIENIDEILQIELTKLGILQKNKLIHIQIDEITILFLVKNISPASIVLCQGDEVSLEFYKEPSPVRAPTPIPAPVQELEPSSFPSPSSKPRFNPWRNKDFKPNVS